MLKRFLTKFSIGCWDLNSLVAHNFTNVASLKAYLFVQKFDIFCISEIYLSILLLQRMAAIWKYLDKIYVDLFIFPIVRDEALQFITKIFFPWN